MTDNEQIATMIDKYMDLLRIIQAEDKVKEAKNQLRETRAKLEAFGVTVENLTIE
ncbi:MAG: hypothetical protein IJU29_09280 [Oscillospiraceae bacterium]|nr:hypothetical protein [Oscillospiraceae bacterium]